MADDERRIEGEEEEETTMEEEGIAAVEQLIHGCEQHVKENCDQVMWDLESVKNETLKKVEATECEIIKQCSEKVNAANESMSGETTQKLKEMECGILRMCNERMDVAIDQIKKDTSKKMLDLEGFIMKRCNDRMDHILKKMREEVVLGFEQRLTEVENNPCRCRQFVEIVRIAGNHLWGEEDVNKTTDKAADSACQDNASLGIINETNDTIYISEDTPAPKKSKEKNVEEDNIRDDCEEGLKVVTIEKKGRGVIATKKFKRGDFIVEYEGELISITEAKDRELQYSTDTSMGCYMYYFNFKNKKYCIDASAESGRLGRLLNHSRLGNCIPKLKNVKGKPRLIFVAARDIIEGEELVYDYGDRSEASVESHPWLKY